MAPPHARWHGDATKESAQVNNSSTLHLGQHQYHREQKSSNRGGGDGLDPASRDDGVGDGGTPGVVGVFRRGERMGSGGER